MREGTGASGLADLPDVTLAPKSASDPLGLSLRACNPANALESVYHVLDVLEGSPAEVSTHVCRRES